MKAFLIGGGDVGRGNTSYQLDEIDREIVSFCGKSHPNLLFIGFASQFSDSYYDIIKKIYHNLGCSTSCLRIKNLKGNYAAAIEKISSADIIYIGGGDTIRLMEIIDEFQLFSYLKDALDRDCVMVGISAGAIALCKKGFSDSYILRGESESFQFIDGLGLIPILICPHFSLHSDRAIQLSSLQSFSDILYGLEDYSALKVHNNNVFPYCTHQASVYIWNDSKFEIIS